MSAEKLTVWRRFGLAVAGIFFLVICVAILPADSSGPSSGPATPEPATSGSAASGSTTSERDTGFETLVGNYTAERFGDSIQIWLRMADRFHFSTRIPAAAFKPRADGFVEVRRAAGAFVLRRFDLNAAGKQAGRYTFEPDPAFVDALAERGHTEPQDLQLFQLAAHDVTLRYLDELAELGYRENLQGLIEMRTHGVGASYIRDFIALGYSDLSARRLVEMRIHGVNAEAVRELVALGYADLSPQRLIELRIHGVDPSWIGELATLGYGDLSAQRLVEMRIHGVDPEWVRELQDLGYGDDAISARQLVEMRIHGVEPEWIRELGEPRPSARQLIERRIHGG